MNSDLTTLDTQTWPQYTPKQLLENPLIDRGNGLRALAKRHAQLLIRTNIWQRPPSWISALDDRTLSHQCAFWLYCRLVRRYGVACPLPDEREAIDPMWWKTDPIAQETESQGLARILYIAVFADELGRYAWNYLAKHDGRWNRRIYELELAASSADQGAGV